MAQGVGRLGSWQVDIFETSQLVVYMVAQAKQMWIVHLRVELTF